MKKIVLMALVMSLGWAVTAVAIAPDIIGKYSTGAKQQLDAKRGEDLWKRQVASEDGKQRSCATCHGDDLSAQGKHAKSGKVIEPMAPSVNAKRFVKVKKIEKWFKRNCKWTWGRECSAQEKGDLLAYLSKF
jgi:hypothetical protein